MILAPLVAKKYGTYILAGISSFGRLCEENESNVDNNQQELYPDDYETLTVDTQDEDQDTNIFGIYTNVASNVNWIAQNSDYTGCQLSKNLQKQRNVADKFNFFPFFTKINVIKITDSKNLGPEIRCRFSIELLIALKKLNFHTCLLMVKIMLDSITSVRCVSWVSDLVRNHLRSTDFLGTTH